MPLSGDAKTAYQRDYMRRRRERDRAARASAAMVTVKPQPVSKPAFTTTGCWFCGVLNRERMTIAGQRIMITGEDYPCARICEVCVAEAAALIAARKASALAG
jgi:hypothetical protein